MQREHPNVYLTNRLEYLNLAEKLKDSGDPEVQVWNVPMFALNYNDCGNLKVSSK